MNIKECYKILNLREPATKEEAKAAYERVCRLCYSNIDREDLPNLGDVVDAYRAILNDIEKTKKSDDAPRFVLKRIPVFGKLTKSLQLHGLVYMTVATIASAVFVSVSAFSDIVVLVRDLKPNKETLSSVEDIGFEPHESAYISKENSIVLNETSKEEVSDDPFVSEEISGFTDTGHVVENRDGVTYVDGYIVVNKTYSLPRSFIPQNTKRPVTKEMGADFLDIDTLDAFEKMAKDARSIGLSLWIASGYRSYDYQARLYDKYIRQSGENEVDTYSAQPGHSEHQTGLAFDLNSVTQAFAKTKEGIWVQENCYKYGFIIRYPEGKEAETGYMYEPWHLRYVGVELATLLYNGGNWLTIEDYFGITSEYNMTSEVERTLK